MKKIYLEPDFQYAQLLEADVVLSLSVSVPWQSIWDSGWDGSQDY